MKTDIKRKIAYDALKQGVINEVECNLLIMHCDEIDHRQLVTDKMAVDFYGKMVNNQATINLKDYESK